ncbi:MAG: hypothetical protein A2787_07025 [Omnitrophica WOR_2 bacterium RIFCSPHIGHO2_01_FULL_48_9]|nr:MAG: hypothetical protein A3D10_08305 [Omnitrophica WOR_2 bacterium RIFCSPHIGHO2_02_FULL_48_11]OGX31270.1 MAG: hypothetical protein A2787_07025 [Omnitrophica WOR_2 bacterium RIFCSPHIGHO2_01_FULL_48_9]
MIPFNLIVALDSHKGIGKNGQLPWHLPADLKHFKDLTCQVQDPAKKNFVIMGRKTWGSIPEKFRPLPKRINCVLTRNKSLLFPAGVVRAENFAEALKLTQDSKLKNHIESIFVIGGAEVFKMAIQSPDCQKLYLTHLLPAFDCDVFFPPFLQDFQLTVKSPPHTENKVSYYFAEYVRRSA